SDQTGAGPTRRSGNRCPALATSRSPRAASLDSVGGVLTASAYTHPRGRVSTAYVRWRARPLLALALVCLVSTAVRLAWLPAPCHEACRTGTQHVLIF